MRFLLAILQLCLVSFVYAQGAGLERWMMEIDDRVAVSSLSIPGAHDAATGEGLHSLPGFGVTQSLDIKGLWESGVRAFDLRPAVKDTLLYIYHGRLRTTMSFSEALGIICAQLERYPSEFAIVLLREESDSENESEHSLWPHLVGKAIQEIGNKAAACKRGTYGRAHRLCGVNAEKSKKQRRIKYDKGIVSRSWHRGDRN